ncbi:UvrD-helicase domain-containing protein [Bathymodiolus thermophilus thioautotrophic gill symbiont]|uniref:DNA 3'-5' helicase n=1 Tax=Bathymodiolus thermophilus thioautotrophic gill symbiont TaxID=2360 RepID=A0A8H8XBS7_9GAMM|nr:UvrD-helicase domain-containing protein [Bathymodiolus thermophilus thioautotrophic gill symbiont]CAB5496821.1 ATP-dependent DNA helicase pcrA (EC [Bathymodiolus thermophilus thioautotrophic gill symbiont]
MNDLTQRQQALDISQSFIIQAPAGSGKTELLTQRYLKLLTSCEVPENIIAMTFTNKAVAEMTQRVLLALKSSFDPRPEAAHKQITYDLALRVMQRSEDLDWQLLQNPKRLKISTIDGLYSLITNRFPLPDQLVPRQIMADQWVRENAYKEAAGQTLLMIDDEEYGQAIASLLLHLDNNVVRFESLVVQMLSKRDQWLTRLYRDGVIDPEVLQNTAKTIVIKSLEGLRNLAELHLREDFFALMLSSNNLHFNTVTALPDADCADLEKWKLIAEFCLTKTGGWRKALEKKLPAELFNEALRLELKQLHTLPDVVFSQEQSDILATIAKVLKLCVAQLNLHFECEQAHDFIEVALNANQALDETVGVSDIALFLDYKVQHLLIDEFQDTSASQFNTIEKLINEWQEGDGKTLFLVGDPMQSIYRFRESQVGLFLQVQDQGIADIAPKSLILSTNFRSSKSIVEGNNHFFQAIFPVHNDVYQGAISYSHSHSNSDDEQAQAIVFHPFAHDQFGLEAQTVSKIVKTSLEENASGTIAVLVRTRSHLEYISQQLKDDNIIFESVEITKLQNHLLTRDLLSLTKALLHLGDKLAWLSILRAPWCGLVLNDLLVLSADDSCVIYQQLVDTSMLEKLSQDGQKRAKHLHYCLQDAVNNQGRFNFVELLTHTINQLGLENATLSNTELAIKDEFLQIIHHCEQHNNLNISAITSAMESLYAPSDKAQVKLMTIHASKGLEFDTVIIPSLGKKPRSDSAPIIQLREFPQQSLLLAPIKSALDMRESDTYEYLKFIESQQNKFETMRLLYVAMTRAKTNLHLLGAVSQSDKASSNSLLAFLMPFFTHRFEKIDTTPDTVTDLKTPLLHRFSQLQASTNKEQTQGESVQYQQNFERLFKSTLGSLVHQYYEQQLFTPSTQNIRNRLIEIGTAPQDIERWQGFIVKLLENTKSDSKFDWLFKARESAVNEAEFIVDGRTIAIDRLFIDQGTLWIIDFKTAEPADNEPLQKFIQRQQDQHTKQLSFYKTALSEIYKIPVRCALYCPAIPVLIELPAS